MKLIKSFKYAIEGIIYAFKTQANFRIHMGAAVIVNAAAYYFQLERWEWVSIWFCIMAVLSAEILNTAVEKLVDSIYKDIHPIAKQIKDLSAGFVLVCALVSIVIGLLIFVPKII